MYGTHTHLNMWQLRYKPDPAPGGAYRGRAPPTGCLCPSKRKLFPPKRGLCPEEINRLGATGAQFKAQISVFCGLTPDFVTFLLWRPFLFLEITCFRPEKPLEILISAGKSLEIFAPHLVHLIQSEINFSWSRAPLEFTQNKLLVPPQNLFLPPPSHAILAPGLLQTTLSVLWTE